MGPDHLAKGGPREEFRPLGVSARGTVRPVRIHLDTGRATTVVGQPARYPTGVVLGPLPGRLTRPGGLTVGADGELFITDMYENAVLVARF